MELNTGPICSLTTSVKASSVITVQSYGIFHNASKTRHLIGRLMRLLPNVTRVHTRHISANFHVPSLTIMLVRTLKQRQGQREPNLYRWIEGIAHGSVLFDIGTNYGQESIWASCQHGKTIRTIGFDCGLLASHFCALNRELNGGTFDFVFAVVGNNPGEMVTITANSDTHISWLHKKNVPYSYKVPCISLDGFTAANDLSPTHLKIDVDGAETAVIAGAKGLLSGNVLREIFIEIDHVNCDLVKRITDYGFAIAWQIDKPKTANIYLPADVEIHRLKMVTDRNPCCSLSKWQVFFQKVQKQNIIRFQYVT